MEESKKCNHVFRILCILAFEYTSQVLWSGSTWPRTFSSECGLWDATHKNLPCFRWYFCKTLQPTSIHEQISNGRRKRSAKFTKRLHNSSWITLDWIIFSNHSETFSLLWKQKQTRKLFKDFPRGAWLFRQMSTRHWIQRKGNGC